MQDPQLSKFALVVAIKEQTAVSTPWHSPAETNRERALQAGSLEPGTRDSRALLGRRNGIVSSCLETHTSKARLGRHEYATTSRQGPGEGRDGIRRIHVTSSAYHLAIVLTCAAVVGRRRVDRTGAANPSLQALEAFVAAFFSFEEDFFQCSMADDADADADDVGELAMSTACSSGPIGAVARPSVGFRRAALSECLLCCAAAYLRHLLPVPRALTSTASTTLTDPMSQDGAASRGHAVVVVLADVNWHAARVIRAMQGICCGICDQEVEDGALYVSAAADATPPSRLAPYIEALPPASASSSLPSHGRCPDYSFTVTTLPAGHGVVEPQDSLPLNPSCHLDTSYRIHESYLACPGLRLP
ncbi:hypothetical protein TRIATDRAFT_270940 [Trichoderma atroviride IMI 206040]|uniref:Uncharacterized protein n=1 Tax=Hypocrea atroviridis (strain ATCC 20476 / IMI 206040) TaxID=452589 RepID=G9NJ28_HYPAI|nr:uncharacterized protein TRIATDRAFT_270940 [Trichoderma atroviride IMI 206040]EHK48905.1 hypothetical protein TRIATDRAFT_270940 [Trichoderma atroviride IMI 206040]